MLCVEITDVRTQPSSPRNAELVHTVSDKGQAVPAADAATALNTLLDQELAIQLDRVVVTKARREYCSQCCRSRCTVL